MTTLGFPWVCDEGGSSILVPTEGHAIRFQRSNLNNYYKFLFWLSGAHNLALSEKGVVSSGSSGGSLLFEENGVSKVFGILSAAEDKLVAYTPIDDELLAKLSKYLK